MAWRGADRQITCVEAGPGFWERPTDSLADVVTITTSFENKNISGRILRESASENEARETASDDYKVVTVLDITRSNERSPTERVWIWIGGYRGRE